MNAHAPLDPDDGSEKDVAGYDRWFRDKVARALADPRPSVPNAEAVERANAVIEAAGHRRS